MPIASPGYDAQLVNGDLSVNSGWITSTALTVQRLERRIKTHYGEVLIDRFAGVPWLEWFQSMPPNLALMESYLRQQADTCPGVSACGRIQSAFVPTTRTASFVMDVTLITGESVKLQVDMGTNGNPALAVLLLTPQAMLA